MKYSITAAVLLFAAGTASAASALPRFGILNGRGATAALLAGTPSLPGGLGNAVPLLLSGNSAGGLGAIRNGLNGALVTLTADTVRLHGLRDIGVKVVDTTFDSALPLANTVDPLLTKLASKAEPVLSPVGNTVAGTVTLVAGAIDSPGAGLTGNRAAGMSAALPGLKGLSFQR